MPSLTETPSTPTRRDPLAFLAGGGEMGRAIRGFDWTATALGPPARWPFALKTITRTVLSSRQPMCFWWGPELLQFHNDAYVPILADRAEGAIGTPFPVLWADVWNDVRPFVEEAFAGRGTWMENLPLLMTRQGFPQETFWTFSYSPLHGDGGEVEGVLNIVTETTAAILGRRALDAANAALVRANESLAEEFGKAQAALAAQHEAEKRQRLLQHELSHRMKNTLSMVQAVVTQSLRHASDMTDAAQMASARIQALGRAQDMLTASDWKASDILAVVEASVTPHRDGDARFAISGPPIDLEAQQAMGLALAIHELATNAAKYGALSNEGGTVTISWNVSGQNGFRFLWREAGGPRIETPTRRGFGSRLTERVVPGYFAGEAVLDYAPSGFCYTLDGSLKAIGRDHS